MQKYLTQVGYDQKQEADNGNRYLTGNGYMGVRGTLCDAGPEGMVAVNLAGIYHQKGNGWREPLNAPNPLYLRVDGSSLPDDEAQLAQHEQRLEIDRGVFWRSTKFNREHGVLTFEQQRFCSMDEVHLLCQRITLSADAAISISVETGIDERVWDIHGPHFEQITFTRHGDVVLATAVTDQGQKVCVARRDNLTESETVHGGVQCHAINLSPSKPCVIDMVSAIYTTNDVDDPAAAALAAAQHAPDYDTMLTKQTAWWEDMWSHAAVEIDGDEKAEFAINDSLYHLISIAPRHHQSMSVPARGLSGQTYKGAIFWDTEIFMMDFYLSCLPEVARSCLRYRIDTLPGALEKAKSYGHRGAFYAWESQEGGFDGCTDYNVTDVFTGRPVRTYFRDKQVHISAAVVYALKNYVQRTGDDTLLQDGGAQVVLESARFYLSLISKKIISDVYDLEDVIGPDEYHERVNNNAYTNEMARLTLRYAAEVCPKYLPDCDEAELAMFKDAADHLKVQEPDPETKVIPQFDGYMGLEDVSVAEVRSRLIDPKEYWGGANGVASHTQVIKQADVIAMLGMLGGYDLSTMEANYNYYEPRTEHGSSLSACMYAMCACLIGRSNDAYPLFMKSAEADIRGGGKQWAGLVYIGGTHPAAAGGAYKVLLHGFLGARFEADRLVTAPRLPEGWKSVRMQVFHQGGWRKIEIKAN